MLRSELWESNFDGLLSLVKEYNFIIDVWEIQKHILYHTSSGPMAGQQLHSQSSPGDLAVVAGQRNRSEW